MKDYITKLAEHALGARPGALPVIPSLYAQGPMMTGSTMGEAASDPAWRESDSPADEPRFADRRRESANETIARPAPRNPAPRNNEPPRQNQLRMGDVMRSLFDDSPPRPASHDDAQQPSRGEAQPLLARDTARETDTGSTTPRPVAPRISPRELETSANRSESASMNARDTQSLNEPDDEARQRHDNPSRRTSGDQAATQWRRPVTTRIRPAVAEPVTPKAITPQAQPSFASADQQSGGIQSPALPPTIRITIGRVEVRAVVPPAPQAKPRSTHAPKLPLDEYLRSRNGGRR
jgi:hypothetical protein